MAWRVNMVDICGAMSSTENHMLGDYEPGDWSFAAGFYYCKSLITWQVLCFLLLFSFVFGLCASMMS
jgi:hypothetical protein